MKKTIILLFALLVQMTACAQLGSGHFFKSLQKENLTEESAVERFGQWFALPQETEWQRVGERTDKLGMTRVEYRQYVSGVKVEHSQVLLHIRDGRPPRFAATRRYIATARPPTCWARRSI